MPLDAALFINQKHMQIGDVKLLNNDGLNRT